MDVSVESFLKVIADPNREPAQQLWADLQTHLPDAAGSTKAHQAWTGGYADHIQEVLNIAAMEYRLLERQRSLPFDFSDAVLALFLHDCEKPFRHATDDQLSAFPWISKRPSKSDKEFRKILIAHYGFELSSEVQNALNYTEGVRDADYVEGERIDGPLAAFCHCCDVISARIWYDFPKKSIPNRDK